MVTIKQIAKKAGVSVATVSYALNNKNSIGEQKKKKIKAIAEQMGYIPNSVARSLQSRTTNIIGIVIPQISNSFTGELLVKLENYARTNEFYLLLGTTNNKPEDEIEIIDKFIQKNIDALIIIPGNNASNDHYKPITKKLNSVGVPVLFMGSSFDDIKVNYVAFDLKTAMHQLTKYLIQDKARQDIVFFGGKPEEYYTQIRLQGIALAFDQCGFHFSAKNHVVSGPGYSFEEGYAAITKMLSSKGKLPQAIMAINDMVAYGIMKGLKEHHVKVPGDLMLTGCDNINVPMLNEVGLTTIELPIDEMARLAIATVKNNMGNTLISQQISLQLKILKRNTA
jgi:LacI family transcriptional regulator